MHVAELALPIALLLILIAMIAVIYHKLSKAVQQLRKDTARSSDNTITQIESLMAVYAKLQWQPGVPKSRGWAASPDFLTVLIGLVDSRRPATIVECGSGLSTLVLAASMRDLGRGRVIAFDHDSVYVERTRDLLKRHRLTEWAAIIHAPLVNTTCPGWEGPWYGLGESEEDLSVDMLVIDGPPHWVAPLARYPALPLLRTRLASGAVVVLDDTDRPAESRIIELWIEAYPGLKKQADTQCEKGCVVLAL